MTKTKKIIVAFIILATLIIGIAYAAIENITLHIAGTLAVDPSQANFSVKFSGVPIASDSNKVKAAITDDLNATLNVSGLEKKGETVTAKYTIQNTSEDLSANLSAIVYNSNTEYFKLTQTIDSTTIQKGEATTITITVELIKEPLTQTENSTVGIQIEAEPVQP